MRKYIINGNNTLVFGKREDTINYAYNELKLNHFHVYLDKYNQYEITITDTHRYRLSSTNASSDKFGKCECCEKYASEMFQLAIEEKYNNIYLGSKHVFGHSECLQSLIK